eukprot:SAG11_NODE_16617_length_542_cov_1.334086_1_plen_70_part_10
MVLVYLYISKFSTYWYYLYIQCIFAITKRTVCTKFSKQCKYSDYVWLYQDPGTKFMVSSCGTVRNLVHFY